MKGGEGQGKTLSPPNWLFQSSTLLNSLEEQCEELYLTSIDDNYKSKRVVKGYVDDCDAVTADQQRQAEDTPETIHKRMWCVAQTWSDLLHSSGGEVSMKRSCWGLVWWLWDKRKAWLAMVAEVDVSIELTNGTSTETLVLKMH
eukprot:3842920-Ditylum_brightwellii.AAC.1